MFFDLEAALEAPGDVPERTLVTLRRILPGALTAIVPNPAGLYPLACGPRPDRLGVRVPRLTGAIEPLSVVRRPVMQSSANLSGGADARRLEDVDAAVRAGVDVELDGGELPGSPSTVVDLTGYGASGEFRILREGAVAAPPRVARCRHRLRGARAGAARAAGLPHRRRRVVVHIRPRPPRSPRGDRGRRTGGAVGVPGWAVRRGRGNDRRGALGRGAGCGRRLQRPPPPARLGGRRGCARSRCADHVVGTGRRGAVGGLRVTHPELRPGGPDPPGGTRGAGGRGARAHRGSPGGDGV